MRRSLLRTGLPARFMETVLCPPPSPTDLASRSLCRTGTSEAGGCLFGPQHGARQAVCSKLVLCL
eukprot:6070996-Alexandrium_andersonii.AAC.1